VTPKVATPPPCRLPARRFAGCQQKAGSLLFLLPSKTADKCKIECSKLAKVQSGKRGREENGRRTLVWLNGELVPKSQAKVSVLITGFCMATAFLKAYGHTTAKFHA
jgi:hypothetical protein